MKRMRNLVLLVVAGLVLTESASAGVVLSLGASGVTAGKGSIKMMVGETVTIDVYLSSYRMENDEVVPLPLSELGAGVQFSNAHFGTPFNSATGDIVPNPGDLFLQELSGLMDAQYFASPGDTLLHEGTFFAFQLTAIAAGTGTIEFDPNSLFAADEDLNPITDFEELKLQAGKHSGMINYTITAAEVPEPASLAGWSLLMLAGCAQFHRRQRSWRKSGTDRANQPADTCQSKELT